MVLRAPGQINSLVVVGDLLLSIVYALGAEQIDGRDSFHRVDVIIYSSRDFGLTWEERGRPRHDDSSILARLYKNDDAYTRNMSIAVQSTDHLFLLDSTKDAAHLWRSNDQCRTFELLSDKIPKHLTDTFHTSELAVNSEGCLLVYNSCGAHYRIPWGDYSGMVEGFAEPDDTCCSLAVFDDHWRLVLVGAPR